MNFSVIAKFITAILGNGAVIAELNLLDGNNTTVIAVITLVATMLGVYAVPNGGRTVTTTTQPPVSK